MLTVAKSDVAALQEFAVRYTARAIGIGDGDWRALPELLKLIEDHCAQTHSLLMSFLEAYEAWYSFHERIDREGKQGKLSPVERRELDSVIHKRDKTRLAILSHLGKS